jgi:membrane protease YdiL (CAAX protease family)
MNHSPQWHLVPALAVLGLAQGYLYARTQSLTLVILFHVVFNLRTLVLVTIAGQSLP